MAQTRTITITTLGANAGPLFDLYSNADNFLTPFETNITATQLLNGYISVLVPDGASIIRVKSKGVCQSFIDLPIPGITTTSTTVNPNTTSTTTIAPNPFAGLKIETIYLADTRELALLPPGYVHPCQSQIGLHTCNRAFFEVYGNGLYLGDSKLSNASGAPYGVRTALAPNGSNSFICGDYDNRPFPLNATATWDNTFINGVYQGSTIARYDSFIISPSKATQVAAASIDGCTIDLSLVGALDTYPTSPTICCSTACVPHANVTWVRITRSDGTLVYNGCPNNNFAQITVC